MSFEPKIPDDASNAMTGNGTPPSNPDSLSGGRLPAGMPFRSATVHVVSYDSASYHHDEIRLSQSGQWAGSWDQAAARTRPDMVRWIHGTPLFRRSSSTTSIHSGPKSWSEGKEHTTAHHILLSLHALGVRSLHTDFVPSSSPKLHHFPSRSSSTALTDAVLPQLYFQLPFMAPERGPQQQTLFRLGGPEWPKVLAARENFEVPISCGIFGGFLLGNNMLVTFLDSPDDWSVNRLFRFLKASDGNLRTGADAGALFETLIATAAHRVGWVLDQFDNHFGQLRGSVLTAPTMEDVDHIHVLSSQLIQFRSEITPVLDLVLRLRELNHSLLPSYTSSDDSSSSSDSSSGNGSPRKVSPLKHAPISSQRRKRKYYTSRALRHLATSKSQTAQAPPALGPLPNGRDLVTGKHEGRRELLSDEVTLWLGNAADKMLANVRRADVALATCEELSDHAYNILSFRMNASMERLSIVSVVFLPLTFIASYFGMNFPSIQNTTQPPSIFWAVAAPCTVAFLVCFALPYLMAAWMNLKRVAETFRTDRERKEVLRKMRTMPAGKGRGGRSGFTTVSGP